MAPAEDTVLLEVRGGDREDAEVEGDGDEGYDEKDDEDYDDEWYDDGRRDDTWYGDNEMAMDEASWPVSLALVRAALLAGDVRPLYFLWLLSVQWGERRPTALEPPRPVGRVSLTGSLYLFAEFLHLNADLVAVALEAPEGGPRTAGELLAAARAREAARERAEAERVATERRERLDALAMQQEAEWSEIDELLGAPKVLATVYRDVIHRLTELRELAADRGEDASFQKRLGALLERRGSKPTLLRHEWVEATTGSYGKYGEKSEEPFANEREEAAELCRISSDQSKRLLDRLVKTGRLARRGRHRRTWYERGPQI